MTKTVIVFFNLKSGVNETDYLNWAKEIDLPTVNSLTSVDSFDVFKGTNLLGTEQASPWSYFEVIQLNSESGFLNDIQTDVMTKVVDQFQAFAENAHFVACDNILSR